MPGSAPSFMPSRFDARFFRVGIFTSLILGRAGCLIGPDFLRFDIDHGRLNRTLRLSGFISFIRHD